MTERYWCEQAWLGGARAETGVVLEVTGDRIRALTAGVDTPPAGSLRLAGLTIPALANAHSHAFHRALRGRTHDETGTFWTWRDLMYRTAASLDPDSYYRLVRATFAEMALAGIGVVGEFHYLHHQRCGRPYADANAMGSAVVSAAQDAGIRLTLLDTLYLHGGIDPKDGYLPLKPEQARFSDGDVGSWAGRVEALVGEVSSPTVRVGAAVHSVRAVDPASIETAAAWTRGHDAPLHVHASEQPAENQQCIALHGRSPVEVILEAAGEANHVTLVHATHTNDHDADLLAAVGAGCCLCPTTERDLADGVGPAETLAGAGVGLCVGTDSQAVVDILSEARAVELDQRSATLKRVVFEVEALAAMATSAGYQALGWDDGGSLAPGSLADFATVSLDSVRLAGTAPDRTLASVVYAATSADVTHLVVAGRPVVVDRTHTSVDVAAELHAAVSEVTRVVTLVVDNIAELVTNDPELGEGPLGILTNASVVLDGDTVVGVGPAGAQADQRIDAGGRCALPGFVDSHTHLVFAGDRSEEFTRRMAGEPYDGGGIQVTTNASRQAGREALRAALARRLLEVHQAGTTTVEIKSGYGLSVDSEAELTSLASEVTSESTFLGAHLIPGEYQGRADEYVELVCGPMLEAVRGHVRWVDAFCETGAFDADQSRTVLEAGRRAGLGLRLHANQLGHGPGVQLGVEMGCASVDHCTYLSDDDIEALAASDTVATFLPATDFSTRQPYPDARRAIDAGVRVAIASNCNPGSSYTTSLSFCIALAVRDMHMTIDEALAAVTTGGATALRRNDVGRISVGGPAHLTILDAPSRHHLAYRPGVPLIWRTIGADYRLPSAHEQPND